VTTSKALRPAPARREDGSRRVDQLRQRIARTAKASEPRLQARHLAVTGGKGLPRPPTSRFSIYDGRRCEGFIASRYSGWKAFDSGDQSLGIFPTMNAAANAVAANARSGVPA
jgi:hypothetical protein